MKVDLSLVLSFAAVAASVFAALAAYLSSMRLRGTVYDATNHRVELDRTRAALEADLRRMYDEIYRDRGRWNELNHLVVDAAQATKLHSAPEQTKTAINPERFLNSFGMSVEDIKVAADQVFILTPLNDAEASAYAVVEDACQKAGLRAIRGDEQNISGAILPVIIQEIVRSRFIIANINGRNPNVFYEMGVAQALGKDVLMFAHRQDNGIIPFDIAHQRIIFYDTAEQLSSAMTSAIAQLGWGLIRSIRYN